MHFYGRPVTYKDLPDIVAARALKWHRRPIAACHCGSLGYLVGTTEYVCARCKEVESRFIYEKSTCGSNIHRITGVPVTPHAVEPYRIC